MDDIKLYIPERNVQMHEHFCYKYFPQSKGSPHSLVQNLLKEGTGHLYERYYINNDYNVLVNRWNVSLLYQWLSPQYGFSSTWRCDKLPTWMVLFDYLSSRGYTEKGEWSFNLEISNMSDVTKSEIPDYAYILFDDICDIIGPSEQWPKKFLELFWSRNVGHWDQIYALYICSSQWSKSRYVSCMDRCHWNGKRQTFSQRL